MTLKDILRRLVDHPSAPPPVTATVARGESTPVRDQRVRVGTLCANAGISADPALTVCPDGSDEQKIAALATLAGLVDRVVAVEAGVGGPAGLSADMKSTKRRLRGPRWNREDVEQFEAQALFVRGGPGPEHADVVRRGVGDVPDEDDGSFSDLDETPTGDAVHRKQQPEDDGISEAVRQADDGDDGAVVEIAEPTAENLDYFKQYIPEEFAEIFDRLSREEQMEALAGALQDMRST